MKRFLAVGFLVVLAAVTAMTWTVDAEAGRYKTVQVKWATNADSTSGDRTFLEDENDTTRTVPIDLSDWDFGLNGTTTAAQYATVALVGTQACDGASDTLYYAVEKSWDGVNWTLGSLAAASGASALLQGTASGTLCHFAGVLLFDWDTITANGLSPIIPKMIRLKVAGDQSGSSPAIAGLKCFITYPTLFDY